MTAEWRDAETAETPLSITAEARRYSGERLAAIDQEMCDMCCLHDLVPQFLPRADLPRVAPAEIENITCEIARTAAGVGINVFLAPILDILAGRNDWLAGRTWSTDVSKVAEFSAA